MAVVARTLQAEADLIQIWLYIAGDNPEAADALLDRINQQFELLAANPYMGRSRPEIAPKARSWTVGNYLILYRAVADGVEIVRVTQGSRDQPSLPYL